MLGTVKPSAPSLNRAKMGWGPLAMENSMPIMGERSCDPMPSHVRKRVAEKKSSTWLSHRGKGVPTEGTFPGAEGKKSTPRRWS